MVLAHGGRFDKASWAPQAQEIAAAGFLVLALDFRGYGRSRGPGDADPLGAPLHLDVLAAVRYLEASGVKAVSAVGGSVGGTASADAAIRSGPGGIERIVVLGAAPSGTPEKLPGRKLFIVARDDVGGSDIPRLPRIREYYEKMTGPKRLLVVPGSAHAQFLFDTEEGPRVLRSIVDFLKSP